MSAATPARQRNYNAASPRREVPGSVARFCGALGDAQSIPYPLTHVINVAYSKRTGTLDERVRKEFICVAMLKEQTKSTYFIAERSDYLNTRLRIV